MTWWKCRCVFKIVLFSSFVVVALVVVFTASPRIVTQFKGEPSMEEWTRRAEKKRWCEVPIRMRMFSPPKKFAVIAPAGVGSTWLRKQIEIATRVTTSAEPCLIGRSWNFVAECTGPFNFDHQFAVVFENKSKAFSFPFYNPTHVVAVWRNPLESIVSAWGRRLFCESPPYVRCNRGADAHDFGNDVFAEFAVEHAEVLRRHYNETADSFMIVHYEDFVQRESVLENVLKYVGCDDCAETAVMLGCVSAADDTTKKSAHVSRESAFSGDVLRKVCDVLRSEWRPQWGKCI